MPRRDGTGPDGSGRGAGHGRQTGEGRGRVGGPINAGPEGYCECPGCGAKVMHSRAEPCSAMKCPQCGSVMTRA